MSPKKSALHIFAPDGKATRQGMTHLQFQKRDIRGGYRKRRTKVYKLLANLCYFPNNNCKENFPIQGRLE